VIVSSGGFLSGCRALVVSIDILLSLLMLQCHLCSSLGNELRGRGQQDADQRTDIATAQQRILGFRNDALLCTDNRQALHDQPFSSSRTPASPDPHR